MRSAETIKTFINYNNVKNSNDQSCVKSISREYYERIIYDFGPLYFITTLFLTQTINLCNFSKYVRVKTKNIYNILFNEILSSRQAFAIYSIFFRRTEHQIVKIVRCAAIDLLLRSLV